MLHMTCIKNTKTRVSEMSTTFLFKVLTPLKEKSTMML